MISRGLSRFAELPRHLRFSLAGFVFLVVLFGVTQAFLIGSAARPPLVDDEGAYLPAAQRLAERDRTSLLPGTLPFDHRPPLAGSTFAFVIEHFAPARSAALLTIRKVQIGVLLVILGLVYTTALALRYGPFASLASAVLFAFSTYFWIYAHTAHSEILHAFFASLALLALVLYARRRRAYLLFLGGVALGLSLLVRGSLQPFCLGLVVWLVLEAYVEEAGQPRAARLRRASLAALPLVGGLFLAVGPQLARNVAEGHGPAISANSWRNIEFGLRRASLLDAGPEEALSWKEAKRTYHDGGRSLRDRETAAKRRTLAYVAEQGLPRVVVRQVVKVFQRFVWPAPLSETPRVAERFSRFGRALLEAGRVPGRIVWYAVLLVGFIGAFTGLRRGPEKRLLALYVLSYLVGFLLVPTTRLVVPLIPALCLAVPSALWLLPKRERLSP
jgi:hypothetical protein